MTTTSHPGRCPATFDASGPNRTVTHRCQGEAGHEGRCHFHWRGGQGGTLSQWWGANPRPADFTDDLGIVGLANEVWRLRRLCDEQGVDWKAGLS